MIQLIGEIMNNTYKYKTIYNKLGDELSKKIYGYRMLYTETEDVYWIWKLLEIIPEGKQFIEDISKNDSEKIIFGAGAWGREIADFFPIGWDAFLDNYENKKEYKGIPIIKFDEYIKNHKDAYIVLTARLHYQSMLDQLMNAGINEERILNIGKTIDDMSKKQYFDLEFLPHDKDEVFVDCGCLDGMTSKSFINWSREEYEQIYAFEPDPAQTKKCITALSNEKAIVYEVGVWDKKEELRFNGFLEGSSYIASGGEQVIFADRLDDVLNNKRVTFIKMDIEGAELKALKGAERLIKNNKPKLAISIYHKPEDIYDIPLLLLEINPDYVFYIRHYSVSASETVLYAIDRGSICLDKKVG